MVSKVYFLQKRMFDPLKRTKSLSHDITEPPCSTSFFKDIEQLFRIRGVKITPREKGETLGWERKWRHHTVKIENCKLEMWKSWSTDQSWIHFNITKINLWNFIAKNAKFLFATLCAVLWAIINTPWQTLRKHGEVQKMRMSEALEKVKVETVILWRQNKKTNQVKRQKQKRYSVHRKKDNRGCRWSTATWKYHVKFEEIQEAKQKRHDDHESSLENVEIILTQLKSCFERDESILQTNLTEEILQSHPAILWTLWRTSECKKHLSFTNRHTYVTWWERKKTFWILLWLTTQTLRFP